MSTQIDSPRQDLFELADTLAIAIGGPIIVEDTDFRVLAYSAVEGHPNDEARQLAIMQRQTPTEWLHWMHETGVLRQLSRPGARVDLRAPWPNLYPRTITGIWHAGQLLGYLWLNPSPGQTPEVVDEALDTLSSLFIPLLAARQDSIVLTDTELSLRSALEGITSPEDLTDATGIRVDRGFHLVGTTIDALHIQGMSLERHALGEVRLLARNSRWNGLPTIIGNRLYLFVFEPSPPLHGTFHNTILPVVSHLNNTLPAAVRAAYSERMTHLSQLREGKIQVDALLESKIPALSAPGSTAGFKDNIAPLVTHRLQTALREVPHLISGILGTLDLHDKEHSTHYAETLFAYLEAQGSVAMTATALHLHPNSVRYRVERAQQLDPDLDLDNPSVRFAVHAALKTRFDVHS